MLEILVARCSKHAELSRSGCDPEYPSPTLRAHYNGPRYLVQVSFYWKLKTLLKLYGVKTSG